MATVSVMSAVFDLIGVGGPPHHEVGLDVELAGKKREIDLAFFAQDGEMPVVVLGECKSRDEFDDEDIDYLELLQDRVRLLPIDCFLVFATLRPVLTDREIARFRQSCERGLACVSETVTSLLPTFPIILTEQALSTHSFEDDHPAQLCKRASPRLPVLAEQTCRRVLGMNGYELEGRADGRHRFAPTWSA
jgi:hypothetical protein